MEITNLPQTISELSTEIDLVHKQMHFLGISTTTSDNDKKTLNEYYAKKLTDLERERTKRIKDIEVVEPIFVSSKESPPDHFGSRIL
jgi:hypothetical protein